MKLHHINIQERLNSLTTYPKTNSRWKIRRVELRDAEIEKWQQQKIAINKHSKAVQCVRYDDTHWTACLFMMFFVV